MTASKISLRLDTLEEELKWQEGLALAEYWGKHFTFIDLELSLSSMESRLNDLPDVELIANAAEDKIKAKKAHAKPGNDGENG